MFFNLSLSTEKKGPSYSTLYREYFAPGRGAASLPRCLDASLRLSPMRLSRRYLPLPAPADAADGAAPVRTSPGLAPRRGSGKGARRWAELGYTSVLCFRVFFLLFSFLPRSACCVCGPPLSGVAERGRPGYRPV